MNKKHIHTVRTAMFVQWHSHLVLTGFDDAITSAQSLQTLMGGMVISVNY